MTRYLWISQIKKILGNEHQAKAELEDDDPEQEMDSIHAETELRMEEYMVLPDFS